jgi:hypothetical protein
LSCDVWLNESSNKDIIHATLPGADRCRPRERVLRKLTVNVYVLVSTYRVTKSVKMVKLFSPFLISFCAFLKFVSNRWNNFTVFMEISWFWVRHVWLVKNGFVWLLSESGLTLVFLCLCLVWVPKKIQTPALKLMQCIKKKNLSWNSHGVPCIIHGFFFSKRFWVVDPT